MIIDELKNMTIDELKELQMEITDEIIFKAFSVFSEPKHTSENGIKFGIRNTKIKPTRKIVTKLAKEALEDLKIPLQDSFLKEGYLTKDGFYTTAHFIVNKEKRTVVALLRGSSSFYLHARGVAKCDPSDCFNEHIGKAIALYRALGKEVPSYFLNAPQPTDTKVGDVIKYHEQERVARVIRDACYTNDFSNKTYLDTALKHTHTVIDDSEREDD